MGRGIVGVPLIFPNTDIGPTKFGQAYTVENDCYLYAWNTPIYVDTNAGTEKFKVGIFANTNIAGLDQPGAMLGESEEIPINDTDSWRRVTFSTAIQHSKDGKYWALNMTNANGAARYAFADGPTQQTYVDATGDYAFINPARAVDGGAINCNNVFVSGFGEFLQVTQMPSHYATTSFPLDSNSASNTAQQNTWTPFRDMEKGDLVIVIMLQRSTATHSIGVTGGQTWSSFTVINNSPTNTISFRVFYCTFNGNWSASPRFDFSLGVSTSGVIQAYRPGAGQSSTWGVDISQVAGSVSAAAGAKQINAISPTNPFNVNVAIWTSLDDNQWSNTSGTDWYNSGCVNQYRNLGGNDQSLAVSHKIQVNAGSTGNVSRSQASNGPDAGITSIFSFYEILAPVGKPIQFNQAIRRAANY
jgi:hypothetical protein